MSNAFANKKLFAAATLLFAVATMINANTDGASAPSGFGMVIAPTQNAEPVVHIGPTMPPSPWDDDSPSTGGGDSRL